MGGTSEKTRNLPVFFYLTKIAYYKWSNIFGDLSPRLVSSFLVVGSHFKYFFYNRKIILLIYFGEKYDEKWDIYRNYSQHSNIWYGTGGCYRMRNLSNDFFLNTLPGKIVMFREILRV